MNFVPWRLCEAGCASSEPAPSVDIKWRQNTQETWSGAVLFFWQY